jgi:hypothetical protein
VLEKNLLAEDGLNGPVVAPKTNLIDEMVHGKKRGNLEPRDGINVVLELDDDLVQVPELRNAELVIGIKTVVRGLGLDRNLGLAEGRSITADVMTESEPIGGDVRKVAKQRRLHRGVNHNIHYEPIYSLKIYFMEIGKGTMDPTVNMGETQEADTGISTDMELERYRSDWYDALHRDHTMSTLAQAAYGEESVQTANDSPAFDTQYIDVAGHRVVLSYEKSTGELYVAFRGTESVEDMAVDLQWVIDGPENDSRYGGHQATRGAITAFERVWNGGLSEALEGYSTGDSPVSHLNVSGHSLGGAMTQLLLERTDANGENALGEMFGAQSISASTFGAPNAFLDNPSETVDWHVPPDFTAYENGADPVPSLAHDNPVIGGTDYVSYGDGEHGGKSSNVVEFDGGYWLHAAVEGSLASQHSMDVYNHEVREYVIRRSMGHGDLNWYGDDSSFGDLVDRYGEIATDMGALQFQNAGKATLRSAGNNFMKMMLSQIGEANMPEGISLIDIKGMIGNAKSMEEWVGIMEIFGGSGEAQGGTMAANVNLKNAYKVLRKVFQVYRLANWLKATIDGILPKVIESAMGAAEGMLGVGATGVTMLYSTMRQMVAQVESMSKYCESVASAYEGRFAYENLGEATAISGEFNAERTMWRAVIQEEIQTFKSSIRNGTADVYNAVRNDLAMAKQWGGKGWGFFKDVFALSPETYENFEAAITEAYGSAEGKIGDLLKNYVNTLDPAYEPVATEADAEFAELGDDGQPIPEEAVAEDEPLLQPAEDEPLLQPAEDEPLLQPAEEEPVLQPAEEPIAAEPVQEPTVTTEPEGGTATAGAGAEAEEAMASTGVEAEEAVAGMTGAGAEAEEAVTSTVATVRSTVSEGMTFGEMAIVRAGVGADEAAVGLAQVEVMVEGGWDRQVANLIRIRGELATYGSITMEQSATMLARVRLVLRKSGMSFGIEFVGMMAVMSAIKAEVEGREFKDVFVEDLEGTGEMFVEGLNPLGMDDENTDLDKAAAGVFTYSTIGSLGLGVIAANAPLAAATGVTAGASAAFGGVAAGVMITIVAMQMREAKEKHQEQLKAMFEAYGYLGPASYPKGMDVLCYQMYGMSVKEMQEQFPTEGGVTSTSWLTNIGTAAYNQISTVNTLQTLALAGNPHSHSVEGSNIPYWLTYDLNIVKPSVKVPVPGPIDPDTGVPTTEWVVPEGAPNEPITDWSMSNVDEWCAYEPSGDTTKVQYMNMKTSMQRAVGMRHSAEEASGRGRGGEGTELVPGFVHNVDPYQSTFGADIGGWEANIGAIVSYIPGTGGFGQAMDAFWTADDLTFGSTEDVHQVTHDVDLDDEWWVDQFMANSAEDPTGNRMEYVKWAMESGVAQRFTPQNIEYTISKYKEAGGDMDMLNYVPGAPTGEYSGRGRGGGSGQQQMAGLIPETVMAVKGMDTDNAGWSSLEEWLNEPVGEVGPNGTQMQRWNTFNVKFSKHVDGGMDFIDNVSWENPEGDSWRSQQHAIYQMNAAVFGYENEEANSQYLDFVKDQLVGGEDSLVVSDIAQISDELRFFFDKITQMGSDRGRGNANDDVNDFSTLMRTDNLFWDVFLHGPSAFDEFLENLDDMGDLYAGSRLGGAGTALTSLTEDFQTKDADLVAQITDAMNGWEDVQPDGSFQWKPTIGMGAYMTISVVNDLFDYDLTDEGLNELQAVYAEEAAQYTGEETDDEVFKPNEWIAGQLQENEEWWANPDDRTTWLEGFGIYEGTEPEVEEYENETEVVGEEEDGTEGLFEEVEEILGEIEGATEYDEETGTVTHTTTTTDSATGDTTTTVTETDMNTGETTTTTTNTDLVSGETSTSTATGTTDFGEDPTTGAGGVGPGIGPQVTPITPLTVPTTTPTTPTVSMGETQEADTTTDTSADAAVADVENALDEWNKEMEETYGEDYNSYYDPSGMNEFDDKDDENDQYGIGKRKVNAGAFAEEFWREVKRIKTENGSITSADVMNEFKQMQEAVILTS